MELSFRGNHRAIRGYGRPSSRLRHTQPLDKMAVSRVVEAAVLAVGRFAGSAAAEMARWDGFAVALVSEKLDEPGLVFNLLVQDAGGHVVGSRIFAERQVANLDPTPDGTPLGFE